MLGWRKHKLESRFPGEISITLDMQMTHHTLMAESFKELINLLIVMHLVTTLDEGERGE